MTSYIQRLPSVFQTVSEKKFFDATFDQAFSKKSSELLYGFIGQRQPGFHDPINDFYLPEPTKNRTWWQLEATAYAKNADSSRANIFFYDELLNRIDYYGGNTLNQDRLFESEYYSWAPPIDFDMFINYQNYYWLTQGLTTINIAGLADADITAIIGQLSYSTPSTATPANLKLTSGMSVQFVGSSAYPDPLIVENIGGHVGIRLVPYLPEYTPGTVLEFLPWDNTIQLANGRSIVDTNWDTVTWDTEAEPGNSDYITIERGSLDRNAWSRTNNWYHIDAINATIQATNTAFPSTATRALRPIIQFSADLNLYKSGTQFNNNVSFIFANDVFGKPIPLSQFQNQPRNYVDNTLSIQIQDGQLCIFCADTTQLDGHIVSYYILRANVNASTNVVTFTPYGSAIEEGDIVLVSEDAPYNGAVRGETWYFSNSIWQRAVNEKISVNQPPLFQLYDHNNIALDDTGTYPLSNFAGSKIFSYQLDTTPGASNDPVLGFPIVYNSLGQATDILFQNNLSTDRYVYNTSKLPINGYYYYKVSTSPVLYNGWNAYNMSGNMQPSKQRVIDRFVVGYGTEYQFKLSVLPVGYPSSPDIVVTVDGTEIKNSSTQLNGYTISVIHNDIYVNLSQYLSSIVTANSTPPVVEISTYTTGSLDPQATGYYEIPQQLRANPAQEEITYISASDLINQFSSIIKNQPNFVGSSFGGSNNYRDSSKNISLGSYILQNTAPALKSMLVSSDSTLDIISAIRFSQDEYTKFKNKFIRSAQQLINQGFDPNQYRNNTIIASAWVDEIIKTVNISKEYSSAFAYSYMVAAGAPYLSETQVIPSSGIITLSNYVDLTNQANSAYLYDITTDQTLLLTDIDYTIVSLNPIEIQFAPSLVGNTIYAGLYKNPLPTYIPSTPSKLGLHGVYVPRIELDTTYAIHTNVIVGHDGSKTVAYNDYRDNLLLELEKRIFNSINAKFRSEYASPLNLADIKSGYFRQTRYTRDEFLEITESYINKWSAKTRANYRINEWENSSNLLLSNSPDLWKLYNYSDAVNTSGVKLNLPGNWKGIFQYLYDTIHPDTRPWEMLGFSSQPSWWVTQYGTNWGSTNTALWEDLEAGIIRRGPLCVIDPITGMPQPQLKWARPGLSALIPVDSLGNIVPVTTLFNIRVTGNMYEPFDGFDKAWVYGDGGPVEQAWMSTSSYAFSIQEFLYLMRPGPFGELCFDTLGTEFISGTASNSTVLVNAQYVQNNAYSPSDTTSLWMRPKNSTQSVHAEIVNGIPQVRTGYQNWISDRILFLGNDITLSFGQKIRTLDVNLANKLAGFTNKDTVSTYIESVSTNASSTSLSVPSNNFDVILHTGQPIKTYSYSGVIIRAMGDGTFSIYGYDLLNAAFTVLDRLNSSITTITVGGTPAPFTVYTLGEVYNPGDIVRYNGVYYLSLGTITASTFAPAAWERLRSLPTVGGVSVDYKPNSATTYTTVPYGSILPDAQSVFDLLIGWGAYLTSQGWQFSDINTDTNQASDWLYCAKQFLFWLNTSWAPDASIQLSPAANNAMLVVESGYPNNVDTISNGVYSILDKSGVAIPPSNTVIERTGTSISVSPANLASGGIYYLQVSASETEHVLIFDNFTDFGDTIYNPLLQARQQRLRFNGARSTGWYGKQEAPGYLIIDNQLVPNFDTIVESMRYYYDPDITIDNTSLESLARHLIGYNSKSYLDNLQMSDNVQYLFYQGSIRQKGTVQAFDKLFRSTKVQSNEVIEVYEEWALKVANFGNTIEQVSTEFLLNPDINAGNVIVARLNFIPSNIGSVKSVNILNAENIYTTVPIIKISAPDASLDTSIQRQATAYAVLDTLGKISRIDILDSGAGYTSSPEVTILSGSQPNNLDILYSVWQGDIAQDTSADNIIDIDIDDTSTWLVRPANPSYSLELPTTPVIDYFMPNAGYVSFNDVNWSTFDSTTAASGWGTTLLNPAERDTVWVASTFTTDWDVYKLSNINMFTDVVSPWKIAKNDAGNLILITDTSVNIAPQFSNASNITTDFGNIVCLQQAVNSSPVNFLNYVLQIVPSVGYDINNPWATPGQYIDPVTLILYNSYDLLYIDGTQVAASDIGAYETLNSLLLFKTMRWQSPPNEPTLPVYVGINDKIWVDNLAGKWAVLSVAGSPGIWDMAKWDTSIDLKWGIPYASSHGWDVTGPLYFTPIRVQEALIDTSLFENAQIYAGSNTELVLLPVYDPFKGILPALAKQNIKYMVDSDPARYNITADPTLFNQNITFGAAQVGQLWWDISSVKYVYCEQPMTLDGSETATENLQYRRNQWGQLFPGSTINIYEWTVSTVPPSLYDGSGIPKDVNTYVQITNTDKLTNLSVTYYYFWVRNSTSLPNIENRTLSAQNVAQLLTSPRSQGFAFFCPIQQTTINNSYIFYNVQDILEYQGSNVQVQYRVAARDDQKHTQWAFFREGDTSSIVTDQFWNKMVDSLCGYTDILPVTSEWGNSITIADYLPWNTYQWDIAPWNDATADTTVLYAKILPVPDPALSESEKYGIDYRPRQSMFSNITSARKVFTQSANNLLKYIPIRDNTPSWNNGSDTDAYQGIYWDYTTWYAVGYENITPTIAFSTLSDANNALLAGSLATGAIVEVIQGSADGTRFALYAVDQVSSSAPQTLLRVAIENSAIMFLDSIYQVQNVYSIAVELRALLKVIRTNIMIDAYLVNQNELFFSMLNYVFSEQKTPDWTFKSSYIYVKENNIPLDQPKLYTPDQIDNIISYITDTKPYHTQVRDYTSSHVTTDVALGAASDIMKTNTIMQFGPGFGGPYQNGSWDADYDNTPTPTQWDVLSWDEGSSWDAEFNTTAPPLQWDSNSWDVYPANFSYTLDANTLPAQSVSQETVFTVDLTYFDASKIGYSQLYPYTFTLDTINNPQTIITPTNIVSISVGNNILTYGVDYYADVNADGTYTVYFFVSPGSVIPKATILWTGGSLIRFKYSTNRTEIAYGIPTDDFVVNVDTKLPVNVAGGIIYPMAPYGSTTTGVDPVVATQITLLGGIPTYDPALPITIEYLPATISYKQNLGVSHNTIIRNSSAQSGTLVNALPAAQLVPNSVEDVITVTATSDIFIGSSVILPTTPGVVWINGERIEYRSKVLVSSNVWALSLLRRGTNGTAAANHPISSIVWAEHSNIISNSSNGTVWNAVDGLPDPATALTPGTDFFNGQPWDTVEWSDLIATNVVSASTGGIWYADTPEATFLKQQLGKAIS